MRIACAGVRDLLSAGARAGGGLVRGAPSPPPPLDAAWEQEL